MMPLQNLPLLREYLQTQEVCDRLVSNAQRMFTDYASGALSSTYQNYVY